MQFYQFRSTITDEKWSEENCDRRVLMDRIRKIARAGRSFNQPIMGKAFFFVTDAGDDTVFIGAIIRDHKILGTYVKLCDTNSVCFLFNV